MTAVFIFTSMVFFVTACLLIVAGFVLIIPITLSLCAVLATMWITAALVNSTRAYYKAQRQPPERKTRQALLRSAVWQRYASTLPWDNRTSSQLAAEKLKQRMGASACVGPSASEEASSAPLDASLAELDVSAALDSASIITSQASVTAVYAGDTEQNSAEPAESTYMSESQSGQSDKPESAGDAPAGPDATGTPADGTTLTNFGREDASAEH